MALSKQNRRAKFPNGSDAMQDKAMQNFEIEKLVCRPQVRERFDDEALVGLAQTMKETGILQPLLVRRDGSEFVVLEGERRLRAAKMAGMTHVPVIIDDRELSGAEVVYRQIIVNCSREGLEPLEKAKAIRRLIQETRWSAAQTAVKLGISPGMMTKLLSLLNLPESVQQKVESGALPLTTAYAISRESDSESQRELANEAANGGLRREDVIRLTKSRKAHRRSAGKPQRTTTRRERLTIPLGGGRSVAVAGPSLTVSSMIEWLGDLIERLRAVQGRNVEVSEAVKLIASQG